jgi:hypothetical protein
MPCGNEHPTRENHAPALRAELQKLHQLRGITISWFVMVRDKEIAKLKKKVAFIEKFNRWVRQVGVKKQQSIDPSSVTIADWNALVKGSEYKFVAFLRLPRSRWPGGTNPLDGAALKSIMHLKQMRIDTMRKERINRINTALETLHTLMAKAKDDEASVALEDWEAALDTVQTLKGPPVLKMTPTLRGYVERAHVRASSVREDKARRVEARFNKPHGLGN